VDNAVLKSNNTAQKVDIDVLKFDIAAQVDITVLRIDISTINHWWFCGGMFDRTGSTEARINLTNPLTSGAVLAHPWGPV
jgi:hypothetical protein